ncbi:MAG: hypothetical protein HOK12_08530 [Candidatus Marinimicrobia bacterium]|nr:hypothetical protein [Candidatus Neomarinimicrobiota bacterium]MBT4753617.1 hypothetical protein [Candidatus Neomarinimicrobiota bacterium]MBT6414390.1 hypothetical protein [Candidatus Neomarinimicrobiota bacterium]
MISIVLGMHRSGTSTVAGILHLNKVIMGTYQSFWPRPLPQNPKGFYENYDFRIINDRLLNKVGYDAKSYESEIPEPLVSDRIKNAMVKIVQKYDTKYEHWGWKDPRTCLTISQWVTIFTELNLIHKLKIIFVTRRAIAVARSLKTRNDLPLEKGMALWKSYTERVLDFCEHNDFPTFYMSFEDLLKSPDVECEKLFDFLGTNFEPSVVSKFIDKNISKSGSGEASEVPEDIIQIESKIRNLILQ